MTLLSDLISKTKVKSAVASMPRERIGFGPFCFRAQLASIGARRSVELQENENDCRQRHLVLTRLGKAKLQEAFPLWSKAQETFTKLYGEKEMSDLRKTLLMIAHDTRLPK